ncbi:MAG: tail fiber domain-containing protein [Bacteroidota bacterium]
MKRLTLIMLFLGLSMALFAQSVGINSNGAQPNSSSILDLQSSSKGLLMPRMTTEQRDAIVQPAEGLMIYNLDDSCFNYYSANRWIKDCGITDGDVSVTPQVIGSSIGNIISARRMVSDQAGNRFLTAEFSGSINLGDFALNSTSNDILVAKISPKGVFLWVKQFGGNGSEFAGPLLLDQSGNIYISGSFSGATLPVGGTTLISNGSFDIFLIKLNPNGDVLWAINDGGSDSESTRGLALDPAGNPVIVGSCRARTTLGGITFDLAPGNNKGFFLVRYNPAGQFLSGTVSGSNNLSHRVTDVAIDQNGNAYVTGYFTGNANFGSTSLTATSTISNAFLCKISPSNQFLWATQITGTESRGLSLGLDQLGEIYWLGTFKGTSNFGPTPTSSLGGDDAFLAKLDPNGQFVWANSIGGTGDDFGVRVKVAPTGESYATGWFRGTITPVSPSLVARGGDDAFVVKFDALGQALWAKRAGGSAFDSGTDLALDSLGNLSVLGSLGVNSIDFDGTSVSVSGTPQFFLWTLNSQNGSLGGVSGSLADLQDGDSDATNELQTLSFTSPNLSLSGGNAVDLSSLRDNLGNHSATTSLRLNDLPIYLRTGTDINHGLRYAGSTSQFANLSPDGPALYGFSGGILGTTNGGQKGVLYWSSNGNVGIGAPSPQYRLQVGINGDGSNARANAWTTWSDSTLKRDFQELSNPLAMLSQINGYHYYWKEGSEDTSRQVGVMAQEIKRVLPELVSTDANGILAVDYAKLTALLIEVNQAQQREIDQLKKESQFMINSFETRLKALEAQQTTKATDKLSKR